MPNVIIHAPVRKVLKALAERKGLDYMQLVECWVTLGFSLPLTLMAVRLAIANKGTPLTEATQAVAAAVERRKEAHLWVDDPNRIDKPLSPDETKQAHNIVDGKNRSLWGRLFG